MPITSQKRVYLTREGLRRLEEEFKALTERRMELVREDGESREDLDFVERRLQHLSEILQSHELITLPPKGERDQVHLGAVVFARCATTGKENEIRLVGTPEANPLLGYISNESPLGRALLGKREGEEVVIRAGAGPRYVIEKILYSSSRVRKV